MSLVLIILITPLAYSAFPEMTPTSLEIDSVEPGETYETNIYLGDDLGPNETVEIEVEVSEIATRTLFSERYDQHERISEQRIGEWWSFEVDHLNAENEFSPEGSGETFEGRIQATLDVPNDAEPGLRYGSINMDPEVVTEDEATPGGQLGFAFSPNLRYELDIEGNVNRDLHAQDVRAFRLDEDQIAIEVLLTNQGTVTTSFENFEVEIIDESRNIEGKVNISGDNLEPEESRWFDATWNEDEPIEEGSYEIDGELNYFTGRAYASGSFSLPEFDTIEVRPEDSPAVEGEEEKLPMWLVLMTLVVLGVLMWSFEIDPVWIFGIMGVLVISAFVWITGVSNLLLAMLFLPLILIIYMMM